MPLGEKIWILVAVAGTLLPLAIIKDVKKLAVTLLIIWGLLVIVTYELMYYGIL